MADNNACASGIEVNSGRFKEAVCIEAGRIFDSCSDKDCLEDLQVFFSQEAQTAINSSAIIKCKGAEVLDSYLNCEPVPFNKGFYAVDITFFFRLTFHAYANQLATPVVLRGCAYYSKKVILYGSEGSVKTFFSGNRKEAVNLAGSLPIACVKAVDPIVLSNRAVENAPVCPDSVASIPQELVDLFGAPFVEPVQGDKIVLVTVGLFTIVTLQRDVQIMIPAYDYVLPEKDCISSVTTDDPCEVFKRIKFPVQEFFPDDLCEVTEH